MNQPFHKRKERLNLFQTLFGKKKNIKVITNDLSIEVCPKCSTAVESQTLKMQHYVCLQCNHHFSMSAYDRIDAHFDADSFIEIYQKANSNHLNSFPDYLNKLTKYQKQSDLNEAVVVGTARIANQKVAVAIMDSRFMMGSMGQIVGEKITRIIELADRRKYPLIIFTASGGARMQEGILSLVQMAKTSAALERFHQNNGLYISILTHPTTGGVSASFAMLGDIIVAEPKALIGFAGRRVIEKTLQEQLPEDFQSAEFLKAKGFVDKIVNRGSLRTFLIQVLKLHSNEVKL